MEGSSLPHDTDLELARQAGSGVVEPWRTFVILYSGLILRTVRRYMAGFDPDDQRALYVEVLVHLRDSALHRYDGSVTLSSWVMIVARSRCLDAVRARFGRKRSPKWLQRVSGFDREVYRLFFVEGLDVARTLTELRRLGHAGDSEAVTASLERLDSHIDRSLRTQLAYDLYSRSAGVVAARLLEYTDNLEQLTADQRESLHPDAVLLQMETRARVARLLAHMRRLPDDERRALELRYWDGLETDAIAIRMDLGGRRRAQRLIVRAIARLRRTFISDGDGDGGHTAFVSRSHDGRGTSPADRKRK